LLLLLPPSACSAASCPAALSSRTLTWTCWRPLTATGTGCWIPRSWSWPRLPSAPLTRTRSPPQTAAPPSHRVAPHRPCLRAPGRVLSLAADRQCRAMDAQQRQGSVAAVPPLASQPALLQRWGMVAAAARAQTLAGAAAALARRW